MYTNDKFCWIQIHTKGTLRKKDGKNQSESSNDETLSSLIETHDYFEGAKGSPQRGKSFY